MTVSELRYLITANELNEGGNGARMSAMAKRLSVTKVSVCNAVERLIANGYFYHSGIWVRRKTEHLTKRWARRAHSAKKAVKAC